MDPYMGEILSGEFDKNNDSFYLTRVKSIETGSDLSLSQLNELRNYLGTKQDSFLFTINDQIPLLFNKEEITSLYSDICSIIDVIKD